MSAAARPPEGGTHVPPGGTRAAEGAPTTAAARPPEGGTHVPPGGIREAEGAPLHATLLRRHQLAYPTQEGWRELLQRPWDDEALEVLRHWAAHRHPLVVTRQPPDGDVGSIALGLPAPARWRRRRLALQLPRTAIAWFDECPRLDDVLRTGPRRWRSRAAPLLAALAGLGTPARVYGSHGWQRLTGLDYVHAGSDLDLWLAVDSRAAADAAAAALHAAPFAAPRLDGELMFVDGAAVSWREWAAWRAGRTRRILVRRLHGAMLVDAEDAAAGPGRDVAAPHRPVVSGAAATLDHRLAVTQGHRPAGAVRAAEHRP